MRHRNSKKVLDRKAAPRKALIANLASSVILYEKVKTTDARARVVRPVVERFITRAKVNTLSNRRYLLARVPVKSAVAKLLEVLGPKYKDRAGGYTRIIKVGRRAGDGGQVVQIELV